MIKYTPELVELLGEAINAYGDVLFKCSLGLEPGAKFKHLYWLSDEELKHKFYLLQDFYHKIYLQQEL